MEELEIQLKISEAIMEKTSPGDADDFFRWLFAMVDEHRDFHDFVVKSFGQESIDRLRNGSPILFPRTGRWWK